MKENLRSTVNRGEHEEENITRERKKNISEIKGKEY